LGEKSILISKYTYEPVSDFFIIKLHDNEQTGEEAAKIFLQEHGGVLLKIENNTERFIEFRKHNRLYKFDPNRIFTKEGIVATLKIFNSYSPSVANEVGGFAKYLLQLISDTSVLIAVHNNTDKNYSIDDYLPGGELKVDAKAAFKSNYQDVDDFIFTTDGLWYQHFIAEEINAVLQHNLLSRNDGSLSVYYGRRSRSYINIEAEYGHVEEQVNMLKTLLKVFENNGK